MYSSECHIVRIYRRGRKNPRFVAGTIETIGEEGKVGFESFEELGALLSSPPQVRKRCSTEAGQPKRQQHS